jgi:hypothetical protein
MDTVLRGWMIRMSLQDPVFWPTCPLAWDMHADANNAPVAAAMPFVGCPLDHALSAFSEDVEARGLSDKVLLVCSGEMGRTGQVVGRSDRVEAGTGTGRSLPSTRAVCQSENHL